MSAPGVRALALVDPGAIERNVVHLRSVAGTELCAVVKADGYGHGVELAARAALAGGASWLAVATAREAQELRDLGIGARLLIMGALTASELELALACDADIVVWNHDFARAAGSARLHVKLDTGLGRLGTRDSAEATRIATDPDLRVVGLMTHFATADEVGDEFFGTQLARFGDWAQPLKEERPELILHAANSAAAMRDRAAAFDLVRCGVGIYGLDPFLEDPAARGLEPALELVSTVAAVKPCAPGESAGYGRRFVATEPTTIATIPIGYGDGVRRGLTNNAEVLVAGRRRPLVGTVSMDNITVEDPDAKVGDEVVLIGGRGGERILAEDVARRLGTINYEITCAISPRVPRVARP